jgi:ABC-2 type transport system ATP-binding protein
MTEPNPDTPAIETTGLRKVYAGVDGPPREALKSVGLSVPPGSVFGLLGPNGAGKSTLINILAGLVVKTSGSARILGWDIEKNMRQARASIGIVPQELNLDAFFSPREVMELQAGFYGVPKHERRTMEILTALGLDGKADVYARSMSGGMRRRLLVAKALVHTPPVVILDEPTAGVDVELRQSLWDYMKELNDAGTTILLTTHYLEEAEEMCDEIAIINHGEIIAQDTTSALLARLDRKEARITVDRDIDTVPEGLSGPGVDAEIRSPRELLIRFPPSQVHMGTLLDAVKKEGLEISDLSTRDTDLEEIFVALTSSGGDGLPPRRDGDPQAGSLEKARTRPTP